MTSLQLQSYFYIENWHKRSSTYLKWLFVEVMSLVTGTVASDDVFYYSNMGGMFHQNATLIL